jgi:hypothetical protein
MFIFLNEEGKKVWGDVFPDGKVPVCSDFALTKLEGKANPERVVLVSWNSLMSQQKNAILTKISKATGAQEGVILEDILKIGLPLRERYTTGTIAAELRFFI